MTQFTLTLLDATGIQDYIFASNRLQENIGASELVYRATSLWAFKALEDAKIGRDEHNIKMLNDLEWEYNDRVIEDDKSPSLKAEVIQAAGGNMLIIFREKAKAIEFVQKLTLRLLKEAPGLTVLAKHLDFDFANDRLADKYDLDGNLEKGGKRTELEEKMREHKQERLPSAPALGYGVTAQCASTGLAAVTILGNKVKVPGQEKPEPLGLLGEDPTTLISAEVVAKRTWRKQANLRLKDWLKDAADEYDFPYDLEKIGRVKGEESYVAIVHADGNRMGRQVKAIAIKASQIHPGDLGKANREYIRRLRKFSENVDKVGLAALKKVIADTVQAVKLGKIPFEKGENGKPYLPLRPLVFGGDDVTFICNGDMGVQLAATYLQVFEETAHHIGLKNFYASAGVSIVKMHYPFSRAYKLAEELTSSAKKRVRELFPEDKIYQQDEQCDCSALDWHFAQSGLSGRLKTIRDREYTSKEGLSLCLRPLTLNLGVRSWQNVAEVMDEFAEKWADKHNKVLGLREPLRNGPEFVAKYRADFGLEKLPGFEGLDVQEKGWLGDQCYYFDPVELLDHHVSLKTKEGEK